MLEVKKGNVTLLAFAAATTLLAGGCCLCLLMLRDRMRQLKDKLKIESSDKMSERMGRIRAEQMNKRLQLNLAAMSCPATTTCSSSKEGDQSENGAHGSAHGAFGWCLPLKPIGFMTSCFTQRNGTPRQPNLVDAARCALVLSKDVHSSSLEGLEQYSHCWVIYLFHENTDICKTLQDRSAKHSKISVPRLNGGKMGVLATRSPHRPVPIGLSTARIIKVEGNRLILGGADIVDGSPVLDIKPYVPFCDSLPATAPSWVTAEAEDEPLKVDEVVFTSEARDAITQGFKKKGDGKSLYSSHEEFVELVKQVLSLDIRSLHKRTGKGKEQQDLFHVILDQIDISYSYVVSEVKEGGKSGISILVQGAELGGRGGRALMVEGGLS